MVLGVALAVAARYLFTLLSLEPHLGPRSNTESILRRQMHLR